MQVLIDTHILIWFLEGNNLLAKPHRHIIADSNNNIYISIASLWEIAIRISVGKLTLAKSLTDVIKQIAFEDIEILSISPEHNFARNNFAFSPPRSVRPSYHCSITN